MTHDSIMICCQREAEGILSPRETHFNSILSFVYATERDHPVDEPISDSDKTSPLAFLATVGTMAFKENADSDPTSSRWSTINSEGKERITVVPGPAGASIRLHKGNGRLPPADITKPFAKKCRNRECNNLGGQLGKPRSIYCSKRCQSREQNLRQGRIKNVRSPTPTQGLSKRSTSPRSSPSPVSMLGASSPIPMGASPSPGMSMVSTSPLTVGRMGMSPSPISLSPVPMGSTYPTNSFSPIPMSSSIPTSNHLATPILLPRPTQPGLSNGPSGFVKPAATKPSVSPGSITTSFSPAPSQQKKFESMESLTLAPILSST